MSNHMLRLILFFMLSISAALAQAFTRAQFVGPTGVIRILAKDYAGVTDTDGQQLYEAMNVPPRDSIIGPGKAFETADKKLRFICAQRSQIGTECSIFIHNSAPGLVDPSRRILQYKVVGAQAKEASRFFHVDASGVFYFTSVEGLFKVDIKPGSFEVLYSESSGARKFYAGTRPLARPLIETLVVVNVEDTLKITHVRNFWDSLNYAQDARKQYLGMSAVLNQLADSNPRTHFVYLIQSPALLAGKTEQEFLKNNFFPQGETRTYRSNADKGLRLEILKNILFQAQAHESLQRVVLLSHNGSADAEAFHALLEEFKHLDFFSYLHLVYSSSSLVEPGSVLYPEQTGYVTALELLVDWEQKGLVDFSSLSRLATSLLPRVLNENGKNSPLEEQAEQAIPRFVSCEDFNWRWPTDGEYQFLAPLKDHLEVRCQKALTPQFRRP